MISRKEMIFIDTSRLGGENNHGECVRFNHYTMMYRVLALYESNIIRTQNLRIKKPEFTPQQTQFCWNGNVI